MATNENSYTDLIHLFIDGEATEVERNTLFNALKDSPALQEELSSAMELKKAFAADIMNLQPPSYLESQIAERAGILVAASAAAANAPVVVNAVSNAVSNVAPVATGLLSKGVITMIVGASVGILSTVGIIKLTSNDNNVKTPSPVAPQAITRQAEPVRKMEQSVTTPDQLAPLNMAQGAVAEKPAEQATVKSVKNNNKNTTTQVAREHTPANRVAERSSTIEDKKAAVENTIVAEKKENAPVTETPKKAEPAMALISPAAPIMPKFTAEIGGESNTHLFHSAELMDVGPQGTGRMSIRFASIGASQLYQGNQTAFTSAKNFDFAGALKYDLDASDAAGIEVGNETFPVYISNGNGGFDMHRAITWVGASFTYTAVYLDLPFNSHLEVRGLGGMSTAGMGIVKGSAGFVIPMSSRLSFSVDGEGTMLFIKSNGANITGSKLAVLGALSWHF
jgi:hypothetical protein